MSVPRLAVTLLCGLGVLAAVFARWNATSAIGFPVFCLAVVLVVYLPGRCLVDFVRADVTPLEHLCLCMTLGTIVSSVAYWLALSLAVPHLFWLWPLGTAAFLVWRQYCDRSDPPVRHLVVDGSHLLLIALLAVAWALLAIDPLYYRNMALRPEGGMTAVVTPADVPLHLALANELSHTVPPQVPFLCGLPLAYHCGLDVLPAMFNRVAGLDILDLTVRFVPTFLLGMTILGVFIFSRAWLRCGYAAVLTTALVIFGEDFSFIPGCLLGGQDVWASYFLAPSTFSLYFMNPMLPALGMLFTGLFCMMKVLDRPGLAWPTLAALHCAALPEYKVFTAAHLMAALLVTIAVFVVVHRDARLLKVLGMTALLLAPVAWLIAQAYHAGDQAQAVAFNPGFVLLRSLHATGLSRTGWGLAGAALLADGQATWQGIAAVGLAILPVYLVGAMGLRCVGVPRLVRDLVRPAPADSLRFLVAMFIALGPVVSLTFTVGNRSLPLDSQYNNGIWFLVQSKYLAWLPAVEVMRGLLRARSPAVRAAILMLIAGTSLPSTVQFFRWASRLPACTIPADELDVAGYLNAHGRPGSVVVFEKTPAVPWSAITRCRTICEAIYLRGFASPAELDRRRRDCRAFWNDWAAGTLATDFLDRYRVTFIVVTGSGRASQAIELRERGGDRPVSVPLVFSTPTLRVYMRPGSVSAAANDGVPVSPCDEAVHVEAQAAGLGDEARQNFRR